MEIVLHIGTDKTGSTAIEYALAANREWFLEHSVYVPLTGFGSDNGHASMLDKLDAAQLKTLAQELESAEAQGYRSALLCWEGMARYQNAQIKTLSRALPKMPTRVLVYLREQAEVIQSGHLQWIKMGGPAQPITALVQPQGPAQAFKRFLFQRHPRRNYYRLLQRWQRYLPEAVFSIRIFDKSALVAGDVIADFLAQFTLEQDDGFSRGNATSNPSLDVEGALLVELWRQQDTNAKELNVLIDITQSLVNLEGSSTRHFFDESAVNSIRQYFKSSNRRLVNHFMPGRHKPLFEPGRCWRDDAFAEVEKRAEERLAKVNQVRQTPTLVDSVGGSELSGGIRLCEGWSAPEPWGVWSDAGRSTIKFRILHRHLAGSVDSIKLAILGRYYGANSLTDIKINDVELGEFSLSDINVEIVFPVTALFENERIEIVLNHQAPISPRDLEGKSDNRTLAFALTSIGYKAITQ